MNKALNASVLNLLWILFFLKLRKQAIKWSLDFPSKVLSSSYFSIHHTGEINPKEMPLLSRFSPVCVPASFFCKNVQEGVCSLLMCVCVCVKGRWPMGGAGHCSGQHQLSECEVQPQAKTSPACGDKPDPPYPPTHIQDQNQKKK